MKSKMKLSIVLIALFLVILPLSACRDGSYEVEDLRLEERHNFSLPEGGEVVYHDSVVIGFDFRDYVVVAYKDVESLEALPWTELKEQKVLQFKDRVAHMNECLAVDQKESIPAELIPDYGRVRGIVLDHRVETMLLFDEQKGMIYICVVKI